MWQCSSGKNKFRLRSDCTKIQIHTLSIRQFLVVNCHQTAGNELQLTIRMCVSPLKQITRVNNKIIFV